MTREERKDRLKLFAAKVFVRTVVLFGAYGLLARLCARRVVEIRHGKERRAKLGAAHDERACILVLDAERFRGDVDIFSRSDEIRVLSISWGLLRYLLAAYVREPTLQERRSHGGFFGVRGEFLQESPGSELHAARTCYRRFLGRFLPHLLNGFGVDVVMNSDHRYRREADFVRIAAQLGFPHMCYYREALYIVPAAYQLAVGRHKLFGAFHGSIIAVQNSITRRMFRESGIAKAEQIVIRGCPRMDRFLNEIRRPSEERRTGKTIAYFSSPRGAQLTDLSFCDFFSTSIQVMRVLVEFAHVDPTVRVVFKFKDLHFKGRNMGQIGDLKSIILEVTGQSEPPGNIEIVTDRMAAHTVIQRSDVVCAMQSTVVLEAGIAGKPVVLPHFRSLREQEGADQVLMFLEHHDLFDVPQDTEGLREVLLKRLADPVVDPETLEKRRALFEEHVSPLDGTATETSISLIRDLADQGRTRRAAKTSPDHRCGTAVGHEAKNTAFTPSLDA